MVYSQRQWKKNFFWLLQKADVDKQLSCIKNADFEIAERRKLEDELTTLQSTVDAATEQNEVKDNSLPINMYF